MSVAVVGNEVDCKTRVAHIWGLAFDETSGHVPFQRTSLFCWIDDFTSTLQLIVQIPYLGTTILISTYNRSGNRNC